MAIGKSFSELEKCIGYVFSNSTYIENALTHASYSNEYKSKGVLLPSNERLEFLGDAILQTVISEYIYDNYRDFSEGKLTRIRQRLVCEKTLARIASKIRLGEYIHLGHGEEADCRERPKILADTLEAVFGAIYIDNRESDAPIYKKIILELFKDEFMSSFNNASADYKTMLQQFIEKDSHSVLEYEIIDQTGPDHHKQFSVVAKVNNNIVGKGIAFSKKNAQMLAAKDALILFGFKV